MSPDPTPPTTEERLRREHAVRRNAVRRFYSTLWIAAAIAGAGTGARIVFVEQDTRNVCFAAACFVASITAVALGHIVNSRMELED